MKNPHIMSEKERWIKMVNDHIKEDQKKKYHEPKRILKSTYLEGGGFICKWVDNPKWKAQSLKAQSSNSKPQNNLKK